MSPEFVEQSESEDNQPIEFVLRKEGLSERAVEVVAFTRNISYYGNNMTYHCVVSEKLATSHTSNVLLRKTLVNVSVEHSIGRGYY